MNSQNYYQKSRTGGSVGLALGWNAGGREFKIRSNKEYKADKDYREEVLSHNPWNNYGTLKNPHTIRKQSGMKFSVLWYGITYSILGVPVNSSRYIKEKKKIENCAIKQSGKVPHKVIVFNWFFVHKGSNPYLENIQSTAVQVLLSGTFHFSEGGCLIGVWLSI